MTSSRKHLFSWNKIVYCNIDRIFYTDIATPAYSLFKAYKKDEIEREKYNKMVEALKNSIQIFIAV
jgi:hypothetical protein